MFCTSHCLKLHKVYDFGSSLISLVTNFISLTNSNPCFFRSPMFISMALCSNYRLKLKIVGMSEHNCIKREVNSMYLGMSLSVYCLLRIWKKSDSFAFILSDSYCYSFNYFYVFTIFYFFFP